MNRKERKDAAKTFEALLRSDTKTHLSIVADGNGQWSFYGHLVAMPVLMADHPNLFALVIQTAQDILKCETPEESEALFLSLHKTFYDKAMDALGGQYVTLARPTQ